MISVVHWFSPTDELFPGAGPPLYPKAPAPVGSKCLECDEPIAASDPGVVLPGLGVGRPEGAPYHAECFVRTLLGTAAHQIGTCSCNADRSKPVLVVPFAVPAEDDAAFTRREHARFALRVFVAKHVIGKAAVH